MEATSWRPSTIAEEEDGEREGGEAAGVQKMVYEEDMPVIVRRRGLTMTVRIFGAEDVENRGKEEDWGYREAARSLGSGTDLTVRRGRSHSVCHERRRSSIKVGGGKGRL